MVNQSLVTREQTLCSRRGGCSCRFCLNSALAREIGRIERGSFPRAHGSAYWDRQLAGAVPTSLQLKTRIERWLIDGQSVVGNTGTQSFLTVENNSHF